MTSPYSQLLEAVRTCIGERAGHYKHLVILVSAGSMIVCTGALVQGSLGPLLAFSALPSLVMAYMAVDSATVFRWREAALQHWSDGRLQLDLLTLMVRQAPNLPGPTVEGMLSSLPKFRGDEVPSAARPALARAQSALASASIRHLSGRSIVWGLSAGLVFLSGLLSQPAFLTGLPVLWLAGRAFRRSSARKLVRARMAAITELRDIGVGRQVEVEWLDKLDRQGLTGCLVSAWHHNSQSST